MQRQNHPALRGYRSPAALAGLPPDTPLLLAFSGGPDSSALLELVLEECRVSGAPLALAHVNHGIRGETARRDRDFCLARANALGLPCYVRDADVPAEAAESGESIETAARRVRYAFFARIQAEHRIPLLLTAHTADDNLETLLFRMLRGSGLHGITGIPPLRELTVPELSCARLVRPLLEVSKRDLLEFCAQRSIPYVTDETNADPTYTRNRIRREVIPALSALCPAPEQAAARLCRILRSEDDYLEQEALHFRQAHTAPDGSLPILPLREQHEALRARILRGFLEHRIGHPQVGDTMPDREHLARVEALVQAGSGRTQLPGGNVRAKGGSLFAEPTAPPLRPLPFPLPAGRTGQTPDGRWLLLSASIPPAPQNFYKLYTTVFLRSATMEGVSGSPLFWRAREPGETILCGGLHRSVRKLCYPAALSAHERAALPLLCDAQGPVWIPFAHSGRDLAIRDDYRVPPGASGVPFTVCLTREGPHDIICT